ncbi:thermonuclease family protein [Agrobacterium larrymoorei]|uniref:thermonuclease family protein n=1 Tax=Agrobacterium larrymoorei TaxID=160699 RepID=UPI0030BC29EE
MKRIITIGAAGLAAAVIAASFAIPASIAKGSSLTGRAVVTDGDTISIRDTKIRLHGIDAVESYQTCLDANGVSYRCGQAAAEALDAFLAASRPTTCIVTDKDRYGRFVARCERADGQSVNAWMVRKGWATDYKRYSRGEFAKDEAAAKSDRLGIWQGSFEDPCVVRAKRAKRVPRC